MLPDDDACYAAIRANDRRFDGRLYVGVTSTRIYCRPVCRVRMPKPENCRYFSNPAAAEHAGFRPCLRCRPELAPGRAPIDAASRLAGAAARLIEAGQLETGGLPALAARLGVTDRHLRRVFRREFGVTPVAYSQTQRLLMAKRMLADTRLPVTEVAMAAGFGSLRRFNAVLRSRYGLSPTQLRRDSDAVDAIDDELRFELAYRPPYDWDGILRFLATRAIPGVDIVVDDSWRRSARVRQGSATATGWIVVRHVFERLALQVTVAPSLRRALPTVLAGVARVFDLACEPTVLAESLGELAAEAPGLRVPGAFDGFEMAVRAILGQQVTVRAAHTVAGRLAEALGSPLETPIEGVDRLFPTPEEVARTTLDGIASLGIIRQRAAAIRTLAGEVARGDLCLDPTADVDETLRRLRAVPGIGEWTAQYIALRALAWPDAWPTGDAGLIKALRATSAAHADTIAEPWRPWRGYAALHLWRRLTEEHA